MAQNVTGETQGTSGKKGGKSLSEAKINNK